MQLDRLLSAGRFLIPLAVIVIPVVGVRLALAFGKDGLDRFVEKDGRFIDRDLLGVVAEQRAALPIRFVRQLVRDLMSPLSLAIACYIAITIIFAVRLHNEPTLILGAALAAGYLGLVLWALRRNKKLNLSQMFEGNLVSLDGPMFGGLAPARVRVPDGRVVRVGVVWRPLQAMRKRNVSFELLFTGPRDRPVFVGFKRT
ncbi:MAG TPA: hypothetical protein VGL61_08710 [Kofleriaceae bacterium]